MAISLFYGFLLFVCTHTLFTTNIFVGLQYFVSSKVFAKIPLLSRVTFSCGQGLCAVLGTPWGPGGGTGGGDKGQGSQGVSAQSAAPKT